MGILFYKVLGTHFVRNPKKRKHQQLVRYLSSPFLCMGWPSQFNNPSVLFQMTRPHDKFTREIARDIFFPFHGFKRSKSDSITTCSCPGFQWLDIWGDFNRSDGVSLPRIRYPFCLMVWAQLHPKNLENALPATKGNFSLLSRTLSQTLTNPGMLDLFVSEVPDSFPELSVGFPVTGIWFMYEILSKMHFVFDSLGWGLPHRSVPQMQRRFGFVMPGFIDELLWYDSSSLCWNKYSWCKVCGCSMLASEDFRYFRFRLG